MSIFESIKNWWKETNTPKKMTQEEYLRVMNDPSTPYAVRNIEAQRAAAANILSLLKDLPVEASLRTQRVQHGIDPTDSSRDKELGIRPDQNAKSALFKGFGFGPTSPISAKECHR